MIIKFPRLNIDITPIWLGCTDADMPKKTRTGPAAQVSFDLLSLIKTSKFKLRALRKIILTLQDKDEDFL